MPKNPKGGKPHIYTHASFVLFFVVVLYKRIYTFKGMEKFARAHFKLFGFPSVPSRKTIRRRFIELPEVLQFLIPHIAIQCRSLSCSTFGFSFAFIDKSVFRAKGGIWHKKDMKIGRVPHPSIDTEGSWAKSAYHGWRFGYGLHVICNQYRFPINAWVTTACVKDHSLVEQLLAYLNPYIGILVGDRGYKAIRTMKTIYQKWHILIQTPAIFENGTQKSKDWFKKTYNDFVKTVQASWLYKKRKPSIEPLFSLIKELFDLEGKSELPFQKLKFVQPFLMTTILTVQLLMYDNFKNHREFGYTEDFFANLR
jgi:Transposase DDE domain